MGYELDLYNIALYSSTILSILGCTFMICCLIILKQTKKIGHKLILVLQTADLLKSFGYILFTIIIEYTDKKSDVFC